MYFSGWWCVPPPIDADVYLGLWSPRYFFILTFGSIESRAACVPLPPSSLLLLSLYLWSQPNMSMDGLDSDTATLFREKMWEIGPNLKVKLMSSVLLSLKFVGLCEPKLKSWGLFLAVYWRTCVHAASVSVSDVSSRVRVLRLRFMRWGCDAELLCWVEALIWKLGSFRLSGRRHCWNVTIETKRSDQECLSLSDIWMRKAWGQTQTDRQPAKEKKERETEGERKTVRWRERRDREGGGREGGRERARDSRCRTSKSHSQRYPCLAADAAEWMNEMDAASFINSFTVSLSSSVDHSHYTALHRHFLIKAFFSAAVPPT